MRPSPAAAARAVRAWLRPSLARRIVLAVLVAFVLVWCALLARSYLQFRGEAQRLEGLQHIALALAQALPEGDAALAAAVMRASESQYNAHRRRVPLPVPVELRFRLWAADGREVYASPALAGRSGAAAPAGEGAWTLPLDGRPWWSAVQSAQGWRVQVLEAALTDADALPMLGRNLLLPLAIAFPFALLPLWLAVRRGLRPLRELVRGVAARRPGDLAPLGLHLKYAELQPLVSAFDGLLEKSRQGVEREQAFVQDAAHELRTPLAVVAAQAHLLARAGDAVQRDAARHALELAVQRASHLVQQLLTLATLDRAEPAPRRRVDVVELARGILIAVAPRAAARGIDIGFDSPDRLEAALDVAAFHSVLENLLNNACAYGRAGGRVAVRLEADAGALRLEVADDGPGIAAEERAHLFERFRRGGSAGGCSGAGLGLAIVRQAVQRLGGDIEVGPGLDGRGVRFTACIPLHT